MQVFNAASYLRRFDAIDPITLSVDEPPPPAPSVDERPFTGDAASIRDGFRAEIEAELHAEFDRALSQAQKDADARLATARASWLSEESAALSQRLEALIADGMKKLRDDAAAILAPFAAERLTGAMLDELAAVSHDALRRSLIDDVTLAGPPDLVAAVRDELSKRKIRVAAESIEGAEASAAFGATTIHTRLNALLLRIAESERSGE